MVAEVWAAVIEDMMMEMVVIRWIHLGRNQQEHEREQIQLGDRQRTRRRRMGIAAVWAVPYAGAWTGIGPQIALSEMRRQG